MSLYHYVANKSEILDGVVDVVIAEIDLPSAGGDWHAELRRRALSARRVLRLHSWSIGLLESRTVPGPATLRHHDAVLGTLRVAGFPVALTAHAYALLDSYIYGFAVRRQRSPSTVPTRRPPLDGFSSTSRPAPTPTLPRLTTEHVLQPGYEFGDEFDFGLEIVLDALARMIPDGGAPAADSGPSVRSRRRPCGQKAGQYRVRTSGSGRPQHVRWRRGSRGPRRR